MRQYLKPNYSRDRYSWSTKRIQNFSIILVALLHFSSTVTVELKQTCKQHSGHVNLPFFLPCSDTLKNPKWARWAVLICSCNLDITVSTHSALSTDCPFFKVRPKSLKLNFLNLVVCELQTNPLPYPLCTYYYDQRRMALT